MAGCNNSEDGKQTVESIGDKEFELLFDSGNGMGITLTSAFREQIIN